MTGVDPIEEFRGTYSTRDEALALIASHGGIVALVDTLLPEQASSAPASPQNGDIGIIRAPLSIDGDMAEIGAIKFGPNWACLGERGVVGKQAEFIAAWEVSA